MSLPRSSSPLRACAIGTHRALHEAQHDTRTIRDGSSFRAGASSPRRRGRRGRGAARSRGGSRSRARARDSARPAHRVRNRHRYRRVSHRWSGLGRAATYELNPDPVEVADVFEDSPLLSCSARSRESEAPTPDDRRAATGLSCDSLWRSLHLGRHGGDADDPRSARCAPTRPEAMLDAPGLREIAVLLPGGGARAAYQVGALRAVARILGRDRATPFRIVCEHVRRRDRETRSPSTRTVSAAAWRA